MDKKLDYVTSVKVLKEVTFEFFGRSEVIELLENCNTNNDSSMAELRGKQGVPSQWNVHQEGGRKDGKCVGNGKEKGWKKKSVRESYDVQGVDNYYSILFGIIINIKKLDFFWRWMLMEIIFIL